MTVLAQDAQARADRDALEDVQQLSGLCERMDSTAFMPVRSEELSRLIGQRIEQFSLLVDQLVWEFVKNHQGSTKDLSTGGSGSTRGRFFRWQQFGCFLAFSPGLWATHGESPIWLAVQYVDETGWNSLLWVSERLSQISAGRSFTACFDDQGRPAISIDIPVAVEHAELIKQWLLRSPRSYRH